MANKKVPGMAKKLEDIKQRYEELLKEEMESGRVTEKGSSYVEIIEDLFISTQEDRIKFSIAAKMYAEEHNEDLKKVVTPSFRSFLNSKGCPYRKEKDGKHIWIMKKE